MRVKFTASELIACPNSFRNTCWKYSSMSYLSPVYNGFVFKEAFSEWTGGHYWLRIALYDKVDVPKNNVVLNILWPGDPHEKLVELYDDADVKTTRSDTCPKCGDEGEWACMALRCRKGHGPFVGGPL